MEEVATLYATAIKSETADYDRTARAFALKGRITLFSSAAVVEAADQALRFVVDLAMRPQLGAVEVRTMMEDPKANVIDAFARACRAELNSLT